MQIDASHVGPNYDKLWSSDYIRHVDKINRILSKTTKKPCKLKTVRSEAKYQNKNIEWTKKFNNHQMYLKLMEISTSKKPKQTIVYAQDETKERMIHNMEMARKRRQIEIYNQNGQMAKRIDQASERTQISELFSDNKSSQSLNRKKYKHKKQKKRSLVQLPSIRYIYNS